MGYNISKKVLAIIITASVGFTLFAVAVWQNWGGLGAALAGAGGPAAAGFYKFAIAPLEWGLSGGWPTLTIFWLVLFIIWPCFVAYITWHYDVPNKITGATAPSPISEYENTMSREPQEPEPAPQPIPAEQ